MQRFAAAAAAAAAARAGGDAVGATADALAMLSVA